MLQVSALQNLDCGFAFMCAHTHQSPDALRPLGQMDSLDKHAYAHYSMHCDICYTSVIDTSHTQAHTQMCICVSLFWEPWKARWPEAMTSERGIYCSHCCWAVTWVLCAAALDLISSKWQRSERVLVLTVLADHVVFGQDDKMWWAPFFFF